MLNQKKYVILPTNTTNMNDRLIQITEASDDSVELIIADHLHAGFPSPASDYANLRIDITKEMVHHPETTFYARVEGSSMEDVGIFDGDIVVVDRSLQAHDGDYVVACVDGEFTLKEYRFDPTEPCVWLIPHNQQFERIRVDNPESLIIWGVVTHNIHRTR